MKLNHVIILFVVFPATLAVLGIDLSAGFNNFDCVRNSGYEFAIGRGYMSYGAVDYTGLQNLRNARAAGLIADAYFFPCKGKKSAAQQVSEFVDAFGQEWFNDPKTADSNLKQEYGTVWVDVEINPSTNCGWTDDIHDNCAFLHDLVDQLRARGKLVGIYGSRYQWQTIFGDAGNCAHFTDLPLWYAHYDGSASFSDYWSYQFGGWQNPSIKQFEGDTTLCGVGVDLNYY